MHEAHMTCFEQLLAFNAVIVRCMGLDVENAGGSPVTFDAMLRELECDNVHVWPSPSTVQRVAVFNSDLQDRVRYATPEAFAAGLRRTLAFHPRAIRTHTGRHDAE